MKNKLILLLVCMVPFCTVLTGCGWFGDDVPKDRGFEYVNLNHEILESIAKDEIPSEKLKEIPAWYLFLAPVIQQISDHGI